MYVCIIRDIPVLLEQINPLKKLSTYSHNKYINPHIKRYWYMCRYQIFKLEGQGKPVVPKMFTDRS